MTSFCNVIYDTIISMKVLGYRFSRILSVGVVAAFVVLLIFPATSYAAVVNDSNTNNANSVEKSYVQKGNDAGVWVSSPSKSYRDNTVDVPYGQSSVTVQIRGSWYTRGYGYQEVMTHNLSSPNGAVYNIQSGDFSRGTASNPWGSGSYVYNNSNYRTATLKIGSACSGHDGGTSSVAVQLRSTFYFKKGGNWITGDASTDYMNVTIKCAAAPWTINGQSYVKNNSTSTSARRQGDNALTATPGDTLYWDHDLRNNGPGNMANNVSINIDRQDRDLATGAEVSFTSGPVGQLAKGNSGILFYKLYNLSYTVPDSAVGKKLCQRIAWTPSSSSAGGWGRSNYACANIPYNYTLSPSVTLDRTTVESGQDMTVTGNIANDGKTKTRESQWQLSYVTIPSGITVPTSGTAPASQDACQYYTSKNAKITCDKASFTGSGGTLTSAGEDHQVFPFTPNYSFSPRIATASDLPVGTKICYTLSIKARSDSDGSWAHSAPTCVVVAKRPVVQVLGGDTIVGRSGTASIRTSTKDISGKRYGSWDEYGVIASGSVSGMASASGYAGGATSTDICNASYLTLNNRATVTGACSTTTLGQYAYGAASATVANRFPISSTTPKIANDVAVTNLASTTTYTNDASGSEIRLSAGSSAEMPAGKWVVINAPGATVKITGDLKYTGGAISGSTNIPQLVIIAKNIIISDNVTRIDAWLVATGTGTNGRINTCGAGAVTEDTSRITSKTCSSTLTVNGPVITTHLLLRRTAGSGTGTASGDPAEVFNLRPDSYLWALALQGNTAKAQTVQTVELPPRY